MSSHALSSQTQKTEEQKESMLSRSANYLRDNAGGIRTLDFLLFFALIFNITLPGINLYPYLIVMAVIVAVGLSRKPLYDLGNHKKIFVILGCAIVYLLCVTTFQEHSTEAFDWTRRILRIVLVTLLGYLLADGRIHIRSAVSGYFFGTIVNVFAWLAGVGTQGYGGVLTGYLGDKNVAGMVYAIFGVLALLIARNRVEVILSILFSYGTLWLTGSRTSLGAYTAALLWILIAPKLNFWFKAVYGYLIYVILDILTRDYAQTGAFSDRAGTDALRARIDEAALEKASHTGFFGKGLGEAIVPIDNRTWIFHNSYVGAYVEGGWPWLLLLLALSVFVIVALRYSNTAPSRTNLIIQGAGVALLVCSWRLGEVLYTWQWCLVLGLAIRVALVEKEAISQGIDVKGADLDLDSKIKIGKK
ncbi:MAG: hypothetical protein Q4P78_03625 [Rothia sp. (in: high G+C Gram-positive bacteria)]|uniref:hypothetical protein n=1 Tax=Rothia sp. (in: high G+C Gram-positive bacteria) TaxID=1885016 RepID=UPI0026DEEE2B|nr:hypothetical protein [Rothia sp. (in: high G+C Gram-positive bacteria)]MDO5750278.1 hypothetical protein [Rothia sp. (in: high G+C Gram-positive bacteria)]